MTTGTQHVDITDSQIHPCKGMAAASQGAFPVADGSGGQDMTSTSGKDANLFDNKLKRPVLQDYAEQVNALGNVTGAVVIDLSLGNVVTATLTGSITISFTNFAPSGKLGTLYAEFTQGGAGSYTITWPGAVDWAGATPPTLTTTVGKTDVFTFTTIDAGTNVKGFTGGLNF